MGDTTFFDILRARSASARVPLVTIERRPTDAATSDLSVVAITDAGRDVLAGRSDHVALNGIDRWRGGVHLVGRGPQPVALGRAAAKRWYHE